MRKRRRPKNQSPNKVLSQLVTYAVGGLLWWSTVVTSSRSDEASSVWDAIVDRPDLTTFASCIKASHPSTLRSDDDGPFYSVFAPTNDAFTKANINNPCGPDQSQAAITRFVNYSISTTTAPFDETYFGMSFATLLPITSSDEGAPPAFSSLSLFRVYPNPLEDQGYPTIQYINDANCTAWDPVPLEASSPSSHYLITIDKILQVPPERSSASESSWGGSIVDVLESQPEVYSETLQMLTQVPDLYQALAQVQPDDPWTAYTFFAPDNEAWSALSPDERARYDSDNQALRNLLSLHVINQGKWPGSLTGCYYSQQFFPLSQDQSMLYLNFYSSTFTGLYLPTALIVPLSIAKEHHDTEEEEEEVLLVQGVVPLVATDASANNGVVHRLSSVLPLPGTLPQLVAQPSSQPLHSAGLFTVFTAILQAAPAMNTTIQSGGPYTLMAPTDDAFARAFSSKRLPPLEDLLQDLDLCTSIVQYHTLDSSSQLYLFQSTSAEPFANDFTNLPLPNPNINDVIGRPVFVHWSENQSALCGQDYSQYRGPSTLIWVGNAKVYQCQAGVGLDCCTNPVASNTYALGIDSLISVAHALTEVLIPPPLTTDHSTLTLYQMIRADDSLSAFAKALDKAPDLVSLLDSPTSFFTVWAPSNTALDDLLATTPWLANDDSLIAEVLRYHIMPQVWYSSWMDPLWHPLPTLAFEGTANLVVTNATSTNWKVNNLATVPLETADLPSLNGVLHKLQGVLVPDIAQIAYANNLTSILSQLQSIGMDQVLSASGTLARQINTLFGPLNDYLPNGQELGEELLTYHVGQGAVRLPDDGPTWSTLPVLTLQGATATAFNNSGNLYNPCVNASSTVYLDAVQVLNATSPYSALNGLVYALDGVLHPPQGDLMTFLQADPDTAPFAQLLIHTGLDKLVLSDPTATLTVFVPSRAALDSIPDLDKIIADKGQLTSVLSFHIAPGRLFTPVLTNSTLTKVDDGTDFYCTGPSQPSLLTSHHLAYQVVRPWQTFISPGDQASFSAQLVRPDINLLNGVVHVLDGILTYDGYCRPS